MRPATRVCLRMYEGDGLALPAIITACAATLFLESWFFLVQGEGATVRPYEWLLNCWLFLVLGTSYTVWSVLRVRGAVDPAAGHWFVLAAYGLWMRSYCFVLLFGVSITFGDRSLGEDLAHSRARFLIGVHRYGGIAAFALGLAMVAGCSRRPTRRGGRAAPPLRGSPSTAGPGGRAGPGDARPSGVDSPPQRRT